VALAAYSLKDLRFGFGQPQFTTSPSHDFVFSLPLSIENGGYTDLKSFNLTTVLFDAEGSELSNASSFVPIIRSGENVTIMHNVTLSVNDLFRYGEQFLFNESNITVSVSAGLDVAEVLPAQISTNFSYPWGAPFYNFKVGQPVLAVPNAANTQISVPVSFENHAVFDLSGNITARLYGSTNSLLSESQTALDVPRGSPYDGSFDFNIPLSLASTQTVRSGHIDIYFSTAIFEYGPLVIPYG
jgi:hypothetical protein